jgi:uncharacterized phosphosugar-binding protein
MRLSLSSHPARLRRYGPSERLGMVTRMTRREFARLTAIAAASAPFAGALAAGEPPDAMKRYINRIMRDLSRFRAQQLPRTDYAGRQCADRVAAGGRLLIFDQRSAYSSEWLGRAGGLMGVAGVRDGSEASVHAQDALVIVSDHPADQADLAVARPSRKRGALVVGICPVRPAEESLSNACDIALDNYVSDEDALMVVGGERIAPTSGAINTAILWTLTAAYIEAMVGLGKPPHVWMSIKRPGAKEFDDAALAATAKVGY